MNNSETCMTDYWYIAVSLLGLEEASQMTKRQIKQFAMMTA